MEDDDMLTQPPESPRRDDDGQLYTQPPEETGGAPQRVRMAFALVPARNVADVFCPQMADLAAMTETTVGRTVDNDIVLEMPDVSNIVPTQLIGRRHCTFRTGRDESNRDACFLIDGRSGSRRRSEGAAYRSRLARCSRRSGSWRVG